jgi:hypothetical protein
MQSKGFHLCLHLKQHKKVLKILQRCCFGCKKFMKGLHSRASALAHFSTGSFFHLLMVLNSRYACSSKVHCLSRGPAPVSQLEKKHVNILDFLVFYLCVTK